MPKFVVIGSVPKTFWGETATPTDAREAVFDYLMRGLIQGGRLLQEEEDARAAHPIYDIRSFDRYFAGDTPAR